MGLAELPRGVVRERTVFRFVPARAAVAHERILRIQGYHDFSRVRPAIVRAAQAMAAEAPTLSQPEVAFARTVVALLDQETLRLESGATLQSRAFATTLRHCGEVAVFVLGLGHQLDRRVLDLAEAGDLLEALLLETAAWLCIEDATRQFKTHLRDTVAVEGLRITSRMGPGYTYRIGDESHSWPLEQQTELFGVFGDEWLPVALSSSNAMHPKMSRSGLFGLARLRYLEPIAAFKEQVLADAS